jgi:hypothetical protein
MFHSQTRLERRRQENPWPNSWQHEDIDILMEELKEMIAK